METVELNYYKDRLQSFLDLTVHQLAKDPAFVQERSDDAAQAYEEAFLQGHPVEGCKEIALKVLFNGLHFSKYDTILEVLNREFHPLVKELQISIFAREMLPVCEEVYKKYELDDDFAYSSTYDRLYTELTGTIALWIKENGLPQ